MVKFTSIFQNLLGHTNITFNNYCLLPLAVLPSFSNYLHVLSHQWITLDLLFSSSLPKRRLGFIQI